jgi:hypothetical protein
MALKNSPRFVLNILERSDLDLIARRLRAQEKALRNRIRGSQHVIVSANLEAAAVTVDHAITVVRAVMRIGS